MVFVTRLIQPVSGGESSIFKECSDIYEFYELTYQTGKPGFILLQNDALQGKYIFLPYCTGISIMDHTDYQSAIEYTSSGEENVYLTASTVVDEISIRRASDQYTYVNISVNSQNEELSSGWSVRYFILDS